MPRFPLPFQTSETVGVQRVHEVNGVRRQHNDRRSVFFGPHDRVQVDSGLVSVGQQKLGLVSLLVKGTNCLSKSVFHASFVAQPLGVATSSYCTGRGLLALRRHTLEQEGWLQDFARCASSARASYETVEQCWVSHSKRLGITESRSLQSHILTAWFSILGAGASPCQRTVAAHN